MNSETEINGGIKLKQQKHCFSLIGFGVCLSFVLTVLASAAAVFFLPEFSGTYYCQCALSCFAFFIALPAGWLVLRRAPVTALPVKQKGGFGLFCILTAIAVELALVGNYIGSAIEYLKLGEAYFETETSYPSMSLGEFAFYALTVLVAEPVCEELFFRRKLAGMLSGYGWMAAMLLSSLFYALFHGSFVNFFYVFNLGLVLSYAYLRTGKLKYPVLIHSLFNFIFSVAPIAIYSFVASPEAIAEFEEQAMSFATAGPEQIQQFYEYMMSNTAAVYAYFLSFILSSVSMGLFVLGGIMLMIKMRRTRFKEGSIRLPFRAVGDTVFMSYGVTVYILLSVTVAAISFFG